MHKLHLRAGQVDAVAITERHSFAATRTRIDSKFAQHGVNSLRQGLQVLVHHGCYRVGVDITQVVMPQDIAKPADLAPGNSGLLSLQCVIPFPNQSDMSLLRLAVLQHCLRLRV